MVTVGYRVTIDCVDIAGEPRGKISWFLPTGAALDSGGVLGNVSVDANGTLIIEDVRTVDRGKYTCRATNRVGFDDRDSTVVVQGEWRFRHPDTVAFHVLIFVQRLA